MSANTGSDLTLVVEAVIYSGKRVSLVQKTYLHEDRVVLRDVIRFGKAVAILPIKDNGKAILIN